MHVVLKCTASDQTDEKLNEFVDILEVEIVAISILAEIFEKVFFECDRGVPGFEAKFLNHDDFTDKHPDDVEVTQYAFEIFTGKIGQVGFKVLKAG